MNLLGEWMDPRHVRTFAYGAPIEEENEHPFSFRFFRDLPRRGQVGFYFSSWYEDLVAAASKGKKIDPSRVLGLEATLADNGVHLVKLFFDLDKKAQKKRFRELEGDKDTRWRVTSADWEANRRHAEILRGAMSVLRATITPKAPWQIIDGVRPRAASLECGRALTAAIRAALEPSHATGASTTKSPPKLVLPAPLPKRRLAPPTRMNPNLDYAQVRLGHDGNRGNPAGVLETRAFAQVRDGVLLLEGSPALTTAEDQAVRAWFAPPQRG